MVSANENTHATNVVPPVSKPTTAAGSSAPVAVAAAAITNLQTFTLPENGIFRTLKAWKWGSPTEGVQSPNTLGSIDLTAITNSWATRKKSTSYSAANKNPSNKNIPRIQCQALRKNR